MAGGHHQLGRVTGIRRAKGLSIPCDAGIDFAVGRVHGELIHRSLRHSFVHGHLSGGLVSGADDEVPVRVRRRIDAIGQLCSSNVPRRVGIAGRRRGADRRRRLGHRQACASQQFK